jgi:hypothetical protein
LISNPPLLDVRFDRETRLKATTLANDAMTSFDIVRSRDGDYVFLETNPYGQWLWIEDLTGLPITSAIADALLQ